ncbi:KAP family NTPase [Pendulispora rubella]|uniref:KAP family NTPase n=1 Tax=Pendulispora rubella TaxID=2741070 RepID=A0ABZ2LEY3_9BACT
MFSAGAEQALTLARNFAQKRGAADLSTSDIFFALAELGRTVGDDTAARFFWRAIPSAGKPLYLELRNAPAEEWIGDDASPLLEHARELALRSSSEGRVHLRHLVAALLLDAERQNTPSIAGLFRRLELNAAMAKARLLDWMAGAVDDSEQLLHWQAILSPSGHSIQRSALSDRATAEDSMGFRPSVHAIADFLRHPETKPPLTMSIEGEWGCGKSSFMMQLDEELLRRPAGSTEALPFVVWFDAWKHAKHEEMWATFAVEFLHQVSRQQTWFKRFRGHVMLFVRRVKWRDVRLEVLRAVLFGVAAVLMLLALVAFFYQHWAFAHDLGVETMAKADGAPFQKFAGKFIVAGGWTGALAVAIMTLTRIKGLVGGSLPIDLKKHILSPDYEGRSAFLDQFHDDFGKIVDAYIGDRRAYVFIDDVDRCEVPTAVDLMQALNLMTACAPKLIFIIGMDREKVAAGIAAKYAPLLPYMNPRGVTFGLDFIEKFIQLPFALPRPTEADTRSMLWYLSAGRSRPKGHHVPVLGTTAVRDSIPPTPRSPVHTVAETERFASAVSTDSPLIHDITLALAPALDFNPRRVKQFLNLFRLRAFLAWQTGRLALEHLAGSNDVMTLPQIGKLTAIALRWPLIVSDLETDPSLLGRLQAFALGTGKPDDPAGAYRAWFNDARLLHLLRLGADAVQDGPARTSMAPDYDVSRISFAWSSLGFARANLMPSEDVLSRSDEHRSPERSRAHASG